MNYSLRQKAPSSVSSPCSVLILTRILLHCENINYETDSSNLKKQNRYSWLINEMLSGEI